MRWQRRLKHAGRYSVCEIHYAYNYCEKYHMPIVGIYIFFSLVFTCTVHTVYLNFIAYCMKLILQFSSILSNDQANYSRQRTCLLMASSATLQAARHTSQPSEKVTSIA